MTLVHSARVLHRRVRPAAIDEQIERVPQMKKSRPDPFVLAKDEVTRARAAADALFAEWQGLVRGGRMESDDFQVANSELLSALRNIEWDLQDISEMSIGNVERNRKQFKLSDAEIERRKEFVASTRERIRVVKEQMQQPEKLLPSGQRAAAQRGALLRGADDSPVTSAAQSERQGLVADGEMAQQMLVRQQDEQLEDLSEAMTRLGEMGNVIGGELSSQGRLVDELTEDVAHVATRLDVVQKKVDKMLESKSERSLMCIICIMSVVLIVLLYSAVMP